MRLGVRLEMLRLGFCLVWLGLIWFGLFPCLQKIAGKIPAGKNSRGKELAGKIPSGEKTGEENFAGKRPVGKRPSTVNIYQERYSFYSICLH